MGLTNKALGNAFEAEFCKMLAEKRFWAHNLAQNSAGQPADIIAAKGSQSWLIDCKVCSTKGFPLSRIEDNQWTAMDLWSQYVSTEPVFALKLSNGDVYIMLFCEMQWYFSQGQSYMNEGYIRKIGTPFAEWVERICE
jgi:Holliday junction resolvase